MNTIQNTSPLQSDNIVMLEKLQTAVTNLITRYGVCLGISPATNNLVSSLDNAFPVNIKESIVNGIKASQPDFLDLSWARNFTDSKGYVGDVIRSLIARDGVAGCRTALYPEGSLTQKLINTFASYQRAYGIPSEFSTIVQHVDANVSLYGHDPHVSSFTNPATTFSHHLNYDGNASDQFMKIVKSSVCETLEFKRRGAGGLAVWDTIGVNEIICFLTNVARRYVFWKWISQTSHEQSVAFRGIVGNYSKVGVWNYCQGMGLSYPTLGQKSMSFSQEGYIDFVQMEHTVLSLYNDSAMTGELFGHIAKLHLFLMTIRAHIEHDKETAEFPKTFSETCTLGQVPTSAFGAATPPVGFMEILKVGVPKGQLQFRSASANAAAAGDMTTLSLRKVVKPESGTTNLVEKQVMPTPHSFAISAKPPAYIRKGVKDTTRNTFEAKGEKPVPKKRVTKSVKQTSSPVNLVPAKPKK